MDTLKACIDPKSCGFLTAGEQRVLSITLEKSGEAVDITGATFKTLIPANFGGTVVLDDASHSIVDAESGQITLTLLAANSLKVKYGRKVQFMTNATIGGVVTTFWGQLDEVREPIK